MLFFLVQNLLGNMHFFRDEVSQQVNPKLSAKEAMCLFEKYFVLGCFGIFAEDGKVMYVLLLFYLLLKGGWFLRLQSFHCRFSLVFRTRGGEGRGEYCYYFFIALESLTTGLIQ